MALPKEEYIEQDLIPGLPDLLVNHSIVPRLPWYTRPLMQTISKAWKMVLNNYSFLEARTKELYKPRGLFFIHELLGGNMEEQMSKSPSALLSSQDSDDEPSDIFLLQKYAIQMYDMQDGSWHKLPPIPSYPSQIPSRCSFVSLDKKLFVMGGIPDTTEAKESDDMHMLNIGLGHWWWEQCASLHFSRAYVKCVAQDGHICVVGGTCPAEVYDINENAWHNLPEMVDVQFFCNGILALENQIYAYGYEILDPEILVEPDVNSARVYNFFTKEWSTIKFDFSKCCTSAFGHLMVDIIDGTLITYDITTHNSTFFDGYLHEQMEINNEIQGDLGFYNNNDYVYQSPCHIFDLVVVESFGRPLEVYTLASLYGSRLHELWHGTIDFDICTVTWDHNIACPFRLCQLDSEYLTEMCYMS